MLAETGFTEGELEALLATFAPQGGTANLGEINEVEKCPSCGKEI
jgi:hypothetical protein